MQARLAADIGGTFTDVVLQTAERRYTTKAYLTFVATDENGRPIPVPPLTPESPDEIRRYEQAARRRAERLLVRGARR